MKQNFIIPEEVNEVYLDEKETLSLGEIECSCCGKVMVHPDLTKAFFRLRYRVGQPVPITSGYRCWEHHVAIYKELYPDKWQGKITKQSYHLRGMALDMTVPKGMTAQEFANLAKWAGFTYVYIIDSRHVHGDVGKRDKTDLIF